MGARERNHLAAFGLICPIFQRTLDGVRRLMTNNPRSLVENPTSMKRLIKYDAAIALLAILIWLALVVAEVKFRELWFFKYVFWATLLALFAAFPTAGLLAFKGQPKPGAAAVGVSLLLTPVFILAGVMLVWWLKIAIGGHPS